MFDNSSWVYSEFSALNLGDFRLERRCLKLTRDILEHPDKKIYDVASDTSNLKAAYRFLSNEGFSKKDIFQPHKYNLNKRIKESDGNIFYVIQDTTTLDYTHIKSNLDLLPLSRTAEHENPMKGYFLHTSLVLDQNNVPMGINDIIFFGNDKSGRSNHKDFPIENKKSYR